VRAAHAGGTARAAKQRISLAMYYVSERTRELRRFDLLHLSGQVDATYRKESGVRRLFGSAPSIKSKRVQRADGTDYGRWRTELTADTAYVADRVVSRANDFAAEEEFESVL
jgi:hypothetical protein